jgi:hypothetical protein
VSTSVWRVSVAVTSEPAAGVVNVPVSTVVAPVIEGGWLKVPPQLLESCSVP